MYRRLGNAALSRMRVADGLPDRYVDRARNLVATCERHRVLRPGDEVLELGTGWVHWEATILRLFYDVDVTLYDVCDNRLFTAFRSYLAQLGPHLDRIGDELGLAPERMRRAHDRLRTARSAASFDELYDLMRFTYVLDPGGMLDGLPPSRYALVVSADVLEHVDGPMLPAYLGRALKLLEPGGHSLHQIDLVDHFHYFDPACSPKHFYRYDDTTWRRFWDSDVQYVNRVQRPEWLRLFARAGFTLVDEHLASSPLGEIPRARPFRDLDQDDVDCLQMVPLHRRPAATVPDQRRPLPAEGPAGDTGRSPAPAVSVCIPVLDGSPSLARTIESVLSQTLTDLELVVRDNGSTDGTSDVVRSFDDPRVRLERVETTVPPVQNRNRAVGLGRAPLVKLLCAGDVLHPRCLELQSAALDADESLALAVGGLDLIDGNGRTVRSGGMVRGLVGTVDSNEVVRAIVRHGGNPIGRSASVLFRRADFDRVGGFDGASSTMDLDLWCRLLAHGRLLGIRGPVAACRIHVPSAAGRHRVREQRAFTAALAGSPDWQVERRDLALGAVGARAADARRRGQVAATGLRDRVTPVVPGQRGR